MITLTLLLLFILLLYYYNIRHYYEIISIIIITIISIMQKNYVPEKIPLLGMPTSGPGIVRNA